MNICKLLRSGEKFCKIFLNYEVDPEAFFIMAAFGL